MEYLPPSRRNSILAAEASIMGADGYYFTARYPDASRYPNDDENGSFLFEDSMVDECMEAARTCRSFVIELSRQFDLEAADLEL